MESQNRNYSRDVGRDAQDKQFTMTGDEARNGGGRGVNPLLVLAGVNENTAGLAVVAEYDSWVRGRSQHLIKVWACLLST